MHFGDGGFIEPDVDAAEDAFVILHELGHGLHHWISNSPYLINTQGLSEGIGDYWGMSETRECSYSNTYNEWQKEYQEIFHWGIMPFIEINDLGRTINVEDVYDYQFPYEPHYGAQFLSKALMRIFSDLGKYKTDLLFIESLPFLGVPNTKLQNAGEIIYNTAIDLEYSENDICIIYHHLDDILQIGNEATNVTAPTGDNGNLYMKDTQCDNGEEINPTFEPL